MSPVDESLDYNISTYIFIYINIVEKVDPPCMTPAALGGILSVGFLPLSDYGKERLIGSFGSTPHPGFQSPPGFGAFLVRDSL